jgi:hypothetical protein
MLCDGERPEREHEQAMRDYEREVREYRDRIIEYLDAWVAYDYRLHANAGDDTGTGASACTDTPRRHGGADRGARIE